MRTTQVWLLLVGVMPMAGCGGAESTGPPFNPVANVSELMTTMIDPAADAVWLAVGTIISEEGTDDWAPETDEEWAVVLNGAMTIAEGGNLLMIDGRARDQDVWMRMAQAMTDAGVLAYDAAKARDSDRIFALGEDIYNACDRCHSLYWVGDEDPGRVREEDAYPSDGGSTPAF